MGIVIVISGILTIIGSPFLAYSALSVIGALLSGIIQVIIGLVCIAGSRSVRHLTWAIILLILGIIAGGLAEHANLLVGDVLIEIENTALSDAATLRTVLAQSSSKEIVHLRVLRGGKIQEIEVTLHTREQAA